MANVLPLKHKKGLRREYRLRIVVVFLTFLVIVLGVSILLLIPSYIIAINQEKDIQNQIALLNRAEEARAGENQGVVIAKTKGLIEVIEGENSEVEKSQLIGDVLSRKPAGVSLSRFSYEAPANNVNASMVISGTAGSREILLSFARELREYKQFESVDLPISQLAAEQNIPFTLSITLAE